MDKMTELYDILCDELEKITAKGELTAGSLDAVDKIVDIMKDIEEMGYRGDENMMGRSYRGSYRDGRSYNRMSYAQRSRGRYSRHDIVEQLEDIADSAPNEKARKEIERLITKMEQM